MKPTEYLIRSLIGNTSASNLQAHCQTYLNLNLTEKRQLLILSRQHQPPLTVLTQRGRNFQLLYNSAGTPWEKKRTKKKNRRHKGAVGRSISDPGDRWGEQIFQTQIVIFHRPSLGQRGVALETEFFCEWPHSVYLCKNSYGGISRAVDEAAVTSSAEGDTDEKQKYGWNYSSVPPLGQKNGWCEALTA